MQKFKVKEFNIMTPDGKEFLFSVMSKKDSDKLETDFSFQKIENTFDQTEAYLLNDGTILYRQFYNGGGFLFPDKTNYDRARRGERYWQTNIQFNEDGEPIVLFDLLPEICNEYRRQIREELNDYVQFEGNRFYRLQDDSVVILRKRTESLSEGYWLNSVKAFDYFYHVLSGQ